LCYINVLRAGNMFIPYQNGNNTKGFKNNMENVINNEELIMQTSAHDISGNVGLNTLENTDNSSGAEYFELLGQEAGNDPLWTQDDFTDLPKIYKGGRCSHCKNWVGNEVMVQIQHVLNGCISFKSQGRYHWRHEAILDYLGTLLEKPPNLTEWSAFRCYLDVPGRRTHDEGTVPDQLVHTELKPDIFILDQRDHLSRPEVIIVDLTIPWDGRVDAARSEKLAKFSKLVSSVKSKDAFNVTYQSIEIGSYRQRLSDGSESAIKLLYHYITPKMSFDDFRRNLINLVNLSSYEVFSSRHDNKWSMVVYPVPAINSNETMQNEEESTTENIQSSEPIYENLDNLSENEPIYENLETSDLPKNSSENSDAPDAKIIHEIIEENIVNLGPKIESLQSLSTISSEPEVDEICNEKIPKHSEELASTNMSLFQLLAILLIFCLILVALNVMWNNFWTTIFICCLSLPILRWLGKV